NLIARKIAPVRMMVCAAPAYLETHGIPTAPSELRDHDFLGYSYLASGDDLVLTAAGGTDATVRITPQVRASNGDVLRKLALAGQGITVQPDYTVGEDIACGRLTALLPGWAMNGFYLYAVYPKRDFLPIKVKVFIDYLIEKLGVDETTPASMA
ncbi:MAG: substrate binding domain-containing protein, partial [Rhizomicrobium sp.]